MTTRVTPAYNVLNQKLGVICMAGKVGRDKRRKKCYYVSWYYSPHRKTYKIYQYKGIPLRDRATAQLLLDAMRADAGNGILRIEKYIESASDVVPYLRNWLEAVKGTLSPATYRDYRNSVENHLVPFFEKRSVMLHEIQYDTLVELLGEIKREGKGKKNTMYCLHRCLKYAKKSNRISIMPEFPEESMYQIVQPVIQWLPSDRQEAVISAIPEEHQPIFRWLKYHLRRPGEAMALYKEDFENEVFVVHRGFSDKKYLERTKTGEIHYVPMVKDFAPYLAIEERKRSEYGILSPYLFVNPTSRKKGKHYTLVFLERLWAAACKAAGEDIWLYRGTKHSTASQMINERGYSQSELQMAGDWARLESVKKYGKVEVSARKALLEGKVVDLEKVRAHDGESNSKS